jgi:hypothetical protein
MRSLKGYYPDKWETKRVNKSTSQESSEKETRPAILVELVMIVRFTCYGVNL